MKVLTRHPSESFVIDERIEVTVKEIHGQQVTLAIESLNCEFPEQEITVDCAKTSEFDSPILIR